MKKLLAVLEKTMERGEDAVLVTVIASSGSTPRGAGARMLVSAGGLLAGTIGGGAVEHRCIALAQEQLGSVQPAQREFVLDREDNARLGMVCGGSVQIHFLPMRGGDQSVMALCRDGLERFAAGTPFWLFTPLQEGSIPALWPAGRDEGAEKPPLELTVSLSPEPEVRRAAGGRWFVEALQQAGTVYIFGGGHVAQALVPVLAPLEFPCVVLEDREEFARRELFPQAREVRLIDFEKIAGQVSVTGEDYVCIMTRGHEKDLLVQQQVLRMPARYIGLIGSVKKAAEAAAGLRRMGFSEGELARIVTPIGLPIGGRSPAEIGISIAAQLIQYRCSGRRDYPMREGLL